MAYFISVMLNTNEKPGKHQVLSLVYSLIQGFIQSVENPPLYYFEETNQNDIVFNVEDVDNVPVFLLVAPVDENVPP